MKLYISSKWVRVHLALFALCVVVAFGLLQHGLPGIGSMPCSAIFFLVAVVCIYLSLNVENPSLTHSVSIAAIAIGFSFSAMFSNIEWSNFRFGNSSDILSLCFFLLFIVGVVVEGTIRKRHARSRDSDGNGDSIPD